VSSPDAAPGRRASAEATLGFVLVAVNLRIAIASVSPLLDQIRRSEHLSSGAAGLLTTVPVICFGLFAFVTPRLSRRFGQHALLGMAMAALAAGIALRLVPGVPLLYLGTLVAGAAIAVSNVLMPALVKRDFADRPGPMMGVYTMALSLGAAAAAGLTVPLRDATGLGWRPTLALWGIVALAAVVAWAPQARRHDTRAETAGNSGASLRRLWRDPVAWAVTVFMGVQSLEYYALLAWLPTLLHDKGMSTGEAGWMLSFASFVSIVFSLITPAIDRWLGHSWVTPAGNTVAVAVGLAGLLADPVHLAYLWMTLLGIGWGSLITLALGYVVARSPDVHHTGQLSTMAQGTGYLFASLGPLGLGLLRSAGGWTLPLVVMLAFLVVQVIAGSLASRHRHVLA